MLRTKTKCPICDEGFQYYLKFAGHMLRHGWDVDRSLEHWSSEKRSAEREQSVHIL